MFCAFAYGLSYYFFGPAADGSGYWPTTALPGYSPPLATLGEFEGGGRIWLLYQLPYLFWSALYSGAVIPTLALIHRRAPARSRHAASFAASVLVIAAISAASHFGLFGGYRSLGARSLPDEFQLVLVVFWLPLGAVATALSWGHARIGLRPSAAARNLHPRATLKAELRPTTSKETNGPRSQVPANPKNRMSVP